MAPSALPGREARNRWDWSGLTLEANGHPARVGHLRREFGLGVSPGGPQRADLEVRFGSAHGSSVDRHKGTWWRMAISPADQIPITLSLALHGLFVDGLVQSVVIEQALAIVAPQRGFVLLPAAALRSVDSRTFLILGSAGAGKTTLALGALVAGWTVLGDDHVLVDSSGRCFGLPRRMRIYPSTIDLVPKAASRLLVSERRALTVRDVARRVTVGHLRLPVLIPPERFGSTAPAAWHLPDHVVALDRSLDGSGVDRTRLSTEAAVETAVSEIATDRRRLTSTLSEEWGPRMDRLRTTEREILFDAWQRIPGVHARVPRSWSPEQILEWLASLPLGI